MKRTLLSLLIFIAILLTFSCKKQKKINTSNSQTIKLTQSKKDLDSIDNLISKWHVTNKRIYVLYGYGFNATESVEQINAILEKRYGFDEDEGLICPLVYPSDFKHNGKAIATELFHILAESQHDIAGVLLLGAPDTTHIALGRLQDFWDMNIPYPIIALYPQDDVLGLESSCDIVIDRLQKKQNDIETEEEIFNNTITQDTLTSIVNILDYIITLNGTIPKNSDLQVHAQQMLSNKKLEMYVDPESGIKSINHFVIQE